MRKINKIIVHCSATEEGKYFDREDIKAWHVAGRGWSDIGYHYVVTLDGTIQKGRSIDIMGAHCKGKNRDSIGICYIGGLKDGKAKDTRTEQQKIALIELIKVLKTTFEAEVYGHNNFSSKSCPCFDARKEYREL